MKNDSISFEKEWEDITPLSQFSDQVKILKIKYTKEEKKIQKIFLGVLQTKEISLRVYNLTSKMIEEFPSNYVAWFIRRKCLNEVKEINLFEELNWLDKQIEENQKNYQIWHHRKLLIEKLNDPSHEKKSIR